MEQPVTQADCNIYESERIQLRCNVSTTDRSIDFTISWFYNGQIIVDNNFDMNISERCYNDKKSSVLTIALNNYNQMGQYYCKVDLLVNISQWNENVTIVEVPSNTFSLVDQATYLQISSSCRDKQLSEPLESCAVFFSSHGDCSTITKSSNTSVAANSSLVSVCQNQSHAQIYNLTYTQLHISTTNQNLIMETPTMNDPEPTDLSTRRNQDTNIPLWGYALIVIVVVLAILMVIMTIIVVVLCVDRYQKHQTRGN